MNMHRARAIHHAAAFSALPTTARSPSASAINHRASISKRDGAVRGFISARRRKARLIISGMESRGKTESAGAIDALGTAFARMTFHSYVAARTCRVNACEHMAGAAKEGRDGGEGKEERTREYESVRGQENASERASDDSRRGSSPFAARRATRARGPRMFL